ncbi:response regulator [Paenibacillus sp. GYB004]|uniref:response regulator n=1 Tax=Paenibacillus sp. GYB004 TaxID=2994393 RepID=UPI002F96736C
MYGVLVVDDEKEIRNGLGSQAPWREWGFDHVYTADDGPGALDIAAHHSIDLVVTDIRMPLMSGLELIRELDRAGYGGGMIIISGYDDFHYAKEAFKMGVNDYLLKPVNLQELAAAVQIAVAGLHKRQQDLAWHKSLDEALPRLRTETLLELFERPYRNEHEARLDHRFGQFGLEWLPGTTFLLILIGIDNMKALTESKTDREIIEMEATVEAAVQSYLDDRQERKSVLVRRKQGVWICLLGRDSAGSDGQLDTEGHSFVPDLVGVQIMDDVRRRSGILVSCGVCGELGGIERLYAMLREAEASIVYHRVRWDPEANREPDERAMGNDSIRILQSVKASAERLIVSSEEEIRLMMHGFPELAGSWEIRHTNDLQQKTFEWMHNVFRHAQKLGWRGSEWDQNPIVLWEHLERFDTLDSLQQQVTLQLIRASASIQEQFVGQNQIVYEAEKYIANHFCEPITLQYVAEHVHVTPVWLSKLFKKVTGKNFLEYVTDARLDKACELLKDLNLKVYQISGIVGYQDKVHFSKLFKKKFGMTPQEYRNSRVSVLEK